MSRLPATGVLARRLRQVREALGPRQIDLLVVTAPQHLRYLFNHVGTAGIGVVSHTTVELLVDGRYTESVRIRQASAEACPGLSVRVVDGSYDSALIARLEAAGATARIGFEDRQVTVSTFNAWRRLSLDVGARLHATEGLVESLRVVKDDFEMACLRRAAAGLDSVAESAFRAVQPGVAEVEVAGVIESALRAAGFERPAFDTIVASGPNAALPHHRAGARRLAAGDVVVLDFGGVMDGYCSDLTRTVSVGEPSGEVRRVHAAVLEAQQAAIAAVGPQVPCTAVDRAAREVLAAHGLAEAFAHGTGHGLGLDVHEAPRVSKAVGPPRDGEGESLLRPGMVVTIEPGVYLTGWGGVRIEDDVAVTADGSVVLTTVPRDLRVCGAQ